MRGVAGVAVWVVKAKAEATSRGPPSASRSAAASGVCMRAHHNNTTANADNNSSTREGNKGISTTRRENGVPPNHIHDSHLSCGETNVDTPLLHTLERYRVRACRQ